MSEMPRKDYGVGSVVDYSNETIKRIFFMNTPFSVEATGHDKRPENLILLNADNVDDIVPTVRVSYGNKLGVVTAVTGSSPITSVTIKFNVPSTNTGVTETYTRAELLRITNLFFYRNSLDVELINFTSQGYFFTGNRLVIVGLIDGLDGTSGLDGDSTRQDIIDYLDGLNAVDDAVLIASIVSDLGGTAV